MFMLKAWQVLKTCIHTHKNVYTGVRRSTDVDAMRPLLSQVNLKKNKTKKLIYNAKIHKIKRK